MGKGGARPPNPGNFKQGNRGRSGESTKEHAGRKTDGVRAARIAFWQGDWNSCNHLLAKVDETCIEVLNNPWSEPADKARVSDIMLRRVQLSAAYHFGKPTQRVEIDAGTPLSERIAEVAVDQAKEIGRLGKPKTGE
jgi:hypothetical protein